MQKKVGFKTINNKKFFYIFSKPKKDNKKIVIMCHGFRGTSVGPARTFVDFENMLLKNNYSTLRFDQPNGGNSEGDYLNSSFNEWIKTTVQLTDEFLKKGYQVFLLGQSMGATSIVIASSHKKLKNKIPCILLWVPDPKSTYKCQSEKIYEENGQQYKGKFWLEAKNANFFKCLNQYSGKIHLVYGEKDRYISRQLRQKVINKVKGKNQQVMILKNQDHSPWKFNISQKVYQEEITLLKTI